MFKKQFLALICGLIFSFGFAPFDYWLLSILSISVLYKTIKEMPPKEAFYTGYWFGFGMWLTGISWLYVSIHYHGEISIIGSALLILIFISILSIYSGLLLLLNSNLEKYGFQKLIYLSLPVSWVLIELIRSYLFTGFPWLISGTMLADTLIDGYTPIIGAQGNTFFLVLIGVLLCEIYESFSQKRTALFPIIFLFIVLVPSSVLKNIEWTIPDNKLKVSGYAWSGCGRGIVRVDVSKDNGKTWLSAKLLNKYEYGKAWAWTLWELEIEKPEKEIKKLIVNVNIFL